MESNYCNEQMQFLFILSCALCIKVWIEISTVTESEEINTQLEIKDLFDKSV